jgi:hypothetical protein
MTTLLDHSGRTIRLTRERLEHMLLHPEMAELAAEIAESLRKQHFWSSPEERGRRGRPIQAAAGPINSS